MTDYLIAEFVNEIQEIVKQPIHLTQRIKYTSCDVSEKYIVFGASSGGLYVFQRHPCSFDKLIPSSEGSVSQVCISPDEKIFAFATSKGTICLVEVNKNTDIQVYNEHLGNIISAMKWNDLEELFVGDNTGKISVVINANFITKTMFQTPCSPLLQLDSRIVQIDTCCNFLIVSTLSRCYLCDTEKEQYRQIGQKIRDGEFGGCFYGLNNPSPSVRQQQIGKFKILGEKETFFTSAELENFKIYCARPGLRLWEVKINGTVFRTHQFKQALGEPADLIPINKNDCRLQLKKKEIDSSPSYNFIKMYILNRNFILTFKRDAIYILDPINGRVILWLNQFRNIVDIKIIKNYIYVLNTKFKINVLLFSSLENFILKTLFNKHYLLCSDLVIYYENKLKNVPKPNRLHLLSTLDQKLSELHELELLENIVPILNNIKEQNAMKCAKKMDSGIFIIDNAHINNTDDYDAGTSQNIVIKDTETKRSDDILRLHEQYELEKEIGTYNTKVLTDILDKCSYDDIYDIFIKLEQHAINKTEIKSWCYDKCLYYIYKHKDYVLLIFNINLRENLGLYLRNGFVNLNSNLENSCACNFPLPDSHKKKPKYSHVGECILERLINTNGSYEDFCKKIPFLWGHYLKLQQSKDLTETLPLLLQYNNEEIFDVFLKKFTYDHWHEGLKLFILLKSGRCLKCEKSFSTDMEISWSYFTNKMLKSIGAESTTELLLQYADKIPSNALGNEFYQSMIFSSIAENFQANLRSDSIDFVQRINGSECRNDFEKLLEKTLQKSASNSFLNKPVTKKLDETCPGCKMPLQIPVLIKEKLIYLNCGHTYHNICYRDQKNLCTLCNTL